MINDNLTFQNPRPSRADAVKNRELLLETARQLFTQHGVETTTMSAIAEAAGVGKGTLYRHFENKTELCQALLDDAQRELQDRALARMRMTPDSLNNLRWFLQEVVRFVDRNSAMLCVTVQGESSLTLSHRAHLWWRQTIHGLLSALHLSIDVDYAADVLYVMLDVHVVYFQQTVLHYDTERIINGLLMTVDQFTK